LTQKLYTEKKGNKLLTQKHVDQLNFYHEELSKSSKEPGTLSKLDYLKSHNYLEEYLKLIVS